MLKYKLGLSILLVFVLTFLTLLLYRNYLVRGISVVGELNQFVSTFDPTGKVSTTLEQKCSFFVVSCEGNYHFVSPYFPNLQLSSILLVPGSDYQRTLWKDPLFNIYWVEISGGKSNEGGKFFGPYITE